jgi:thiopurine S-methyltransferase
MDQEFWNERWTAGQIGFHKSSANDLLAAHHEAGLRGHQRVYVPLCGKSLDLIWLRDHGHDVVGCEFVGSAIEAFFSEQFPEVKRLQARYPTVTVHESSGVRIIEGDAFAVDTFATGGLVDAIWDRAALVAVDPANRERYVEALLRVLRPRGVILLVTFSYDQEKLAGPPWSVSDDEVTRLFGPSCTIERLQQRAEPPGPKFVEAGITATESCFLLRRR